jgi:hypothetical protein
MTSHVRRHQAARPSRQDAKTPPAGARRLIRDLLRRDTQDRWAAVFGRITAYSFAVAVVTGVLLLPFFRPSTALVSARR